MPEKQYIRSLLWRQRISKALKGRKLTKEWIEKMAATKRGQHPSLETRMKISVSHKERYKLIPHHSKGCHLSEEHKAAVSKALIEKYKNSKPIWIGRKQSEEERKKRSLSLMGHKFSDERNKKISIAAFYNYGKLAYTHASKRINTKIEQKIEHFLIANNIEYYKNKPICNIALRYNCDFYLPKCNLIIECDGDYWHYNPAIFHFKTVQQYETEQKDIARTYQLLEQGYNILRFWENDINNNFDWVTQKILREIVIQN